MTTENDNGKRRWIDDEDRQLSYDPDRWDPDESPLECQVCGTDLRGAGDRATLGQYCPECEVSVWIK